MLLYMGSGSALAAYRRGQRIRELASCANRCGATYRQFLGRFERIFNAQTRDQLALGIESTRDCQDLCSLTASLVGRGSELSSIALVSCAEACRRCAEACDSLTMVDGAAQCAELCRQTEAICRRPTGY
jgi:hypothetical protein